MFPARFLQPLSVVISPFFLSTFLLPHSRSEVPGRVPVDVFVVSRPSQRGYRCCRWNVFDNTASAQDCLGHGTALASIAAGQIFGVAKAANIVAVKVLDCSGHGASLVPAIPSHDRLCWSVSQTDGLNMHMSSREVHHRLGNMTANLYLAMSRQD